MYIRAAGLFDRESRVLLALICIIIDMTGNVVAHCSNIDT